jgi:hypothetical protein
VSDKEFWITMLIATVLILIWLTLIMLAEIKVSDFNRYEWTDVIWT